MLDITFLRKYNFWYVSHVGRRCNRAAYNLAKWAASWNTFGNIDLAVFCDRGGTPRSICTYLEVVLDGNEDA